MPATTSELRSEPFVVWQWLGLGAVSAVLTGALQETGLPAALLLGPMGAAILAAAAGARLRIAPKLLVIVQGVIGCLIAHAIQPAVLRGMLAHWLLFTIVVLAVIAVSILLGGVLTRLRIVPGSVAVWGSAPGASALMTLMAGAHGVDIRLVAFMQFLRLAMVAITASLVAGILATAGGPLTPTDWFPPISMPSFAATALLACFGSLLGRISPIPAGASLLPLLAGAWLQGAGLINLVLPPWFLAPSYALLGWYIGLSFTIATLRHVARAFPAVAAAIVIQILLCAVLGLMLNKFAGVEPLTAYLATSPGGADAVAIIAASSKRVDISFVMSLQTARVIIVSLAGPRLARFVSERCAIS